MSGIPGNARNMLRAILSGNYGNFQEGSLGALILAMRQHPAFGPATTHQLDTEVTRLASSTLGSSQPFNLVLTAIRNYNNQENIKVKIAKVKHDIKLQQAVLKHVQLAGTKATAMSIINALQGELQSLEAQLQGLTTSADHDVQAALDSVASPAQSAAPSVASDEETFEDDDIEPLDPASSGMQPTTPSPSSTIRRWPRLRRPVPAQDSSSSSSSQSAQASAPASTPPVSPPQSRGPEQMLADLAARIAASRQPGAQPPPLPTAPPPASTLRQPRLRRPVGTQDGTAGPSAAGGPGDPSGTGGAGGPSGAGGAGGPSGTGGAGGPSGPTGPSGTGGPSGAGGGPGGAGGPGPVGPPGGGGIAPLPYRSFTSRMVAGVQRHGQVVNGTFEPIIVNPRDLSPRAVKHLQNEIGYRTHEPMRLEQLPFGQRARVQGAVERMARYFEVGTNAPEPITKYSLDTEPTGERDQFGNPILRLAPPATLSSIYRFPQVKSASATTVTDPKFLPLRMNQLVVNGLHVGNTMSHPRGDDLSRFYDLLFERGITGVHILVPRADFDGAVGDGSGMPAWRGGEMLEGASGATAWRSSPQQPDWNRVNDMPRYHTPVIDPNLTSAEVRIQDTGLRTHQSGKNTVSVAASGIQTPNGDLQVVHEPAGIFNRGELSECHQYTLQLSKNGQTRRIVVLASANWEDPQTLSSEQLQQFLDARRVAFAGLSLSDVLTHDREGTGRAGAIITAEAMSHLELPVLDSLAQLRGSRNNRMVETQAQASAILYWAMERGLPLVSDQAVVDDNVFLQTDDDGYV